MLAVARRDEDALRELYDRHGGAVLAMTVRIVRHRDLAEDIVQELFLRLWNAPERYQPERGKVRTFLFRQAHSRSIERVRSEEARRRREERADRERNEPAYDIEREAWAVIESEVMRDALADLSDGEREAIELAYFGGHTYREVAVLLDVPEGTVKSRIRVGMSKLHVVLAAAGLAVVIVAVLLISGAVAGSREPALTTAAQIAPPAHASLRDERGHRVDVVVDPGGTARIDTTELPPLDASHTYQLWSLDGGSPTSLTTFDGAPASFAIAPTSPRPRQLAVTVEPAGGSAAPTTTPILVGTLT